MEINQSMEILKARFPKTFSIVFSAYRIIDPLRSGGEDNDDILNQYIKYASSFCELLVHMERTLGHPHWDTGLYLDHNKLVRRFVSSSFPDILYIVGRITDDHIESIAVKLIELGLDTAHLKY